MAAASFFRGFRFPFQRGATSFPAVSTDDELIRQSLLQIVLTQKGERVMRPDFGSNTLAFVFENNTEVLAEALRSDLAKCIAQFEPRVLLTGILVDQLDAEVNVTLQYIVRATRQPQQLRVTLPR